MTDAAYHQTAPVAEQTETVPLPAPVPFDAPVLIGDCASPLAGETVLSLLWRRLARSEVD